MLIETGQRADVYIRSHHIVEAFGISSLRSGNDDLLYVCHDRRSKRIVFLSSRRNDNPGGYEIAHTLRKRGPQLVRAHRNEADSYLATSSLIFLIHESFELLQLFVKHASGVPMRVEERDRIDRHEGANVTRLQHLVEIRSPPPEAYRKRQLARCLRNLIGEAFWRKNFRS